MSFNQYVIQLWMDTHGHIGWQRPGRRGPDGHCDFAVIGCAAGGAERRRINRNESHIDGD